MQKKKLNNLEEKNGDLAKIETRKNGITSENESTNKENDGDITTEKLD